MTPLHWAAYNGDEEVIRTLLSAGADTFVFSYNKQLPIDIAGSGKKTEVVDVFLAYYVSKFKLRE